MGPFVQSLSAMFEKTAVQVGQPLQVSALCEEPVERRGQTLNSEEVVEGH
jgi:hypothetical protein